ncbi:MAG: Hsp33 family molecular chaperone HslO [Candidatus Eremiobacteraeota bacterium]|nr:Hsp33 family molecular chaperone HslO [Candidatus Eremiobacteraeota bacterium]MBC5827850.1 Hsp33 family molecular chaperone HslO [Candidatus Eremiobacteraeota bacterium]
MVNDYAICALAANDTVRVVAARTTDVVRAAQSRHGCSPTVSAALGRLLTGAVLMSVSLKGRERVTLQINCDGPVAGLIADALPGGAVRGYPKRPSAELPLNALGKFDVAGIVGTGTLHVTRMFDTGQPYTSAVALVNGEIGEDLAFYFARSEQIRSVVAVGVLVNPQGVLASGGILAQLLPGADDGVVDVLEAATRSLPHISSLVNQGLSPEDIVNRFAAELSPRLTFRQPVAFRCTCDRSRVVKALIGFGARELANMASAAHQTEATCQFCGQRYYFLPAEIGDILKTTA